MRSTRLLIDYSQRPSFTQDQFLTSLRSFANPVQLPADSSDRASSPPLRQHNRMRSSLGDPVKKKRPRELDAVPRGLMLPRSQSSPHLAVTPFDLPDASQTGVQMNLSTIQNPAMLALLSKLVPSLAGSGPVASGSTAPAFGLDSAQGRALIPLIRMLAQTHGIEMPSPDTPTLTPTPVDMSMIDPALSTALDKGKEPQIEADIDLTAPDPYHNLTTGTAPPAPLPVEVQPVVTAPLPKKRAYGGKKKKVNVFAPIVQDVEELLDENGAPIKADTSHPLGCSNCFRKRSSVWRQSEEGTVVCNGTCFLLRRVLLTMRRSVCGIYFNKNGVHRTKPDRGTSPAPRTEPAPIEVDAPPATRANARVLQHRLTATCESDLLAQQKTKRRRTSGPGMVAPPSPSKTIGPMPRRIYSPGTATDFSSIFRQNSLGNPTQTVSHRNGAGGAHVMTSPGRSPRRSARTLSAGFGLAATSPVRGSTSNAGAPFTFGDGGGIEDAVESYDFSALYAGHQSPSPARRNLENGRAIPSYLLTESPGTALKRALNDTNIEIDMHSFDFPMTDEDFLQPGETGGAEELNFYLRSSPDEKENAPPHLIPFPPSTSTLSAPPPSSALLKDQPSTDFDSILSSLRRNFKSQLTSSTALPSTAHTTPSSPIPSSPCVQPRTSSATPGQKSKGPASCGRPAPTIEEGFIGRLIPALALGSTGGDDASWGELSGMQSTGDEYDLSNLLPTAGVPTISAVDSLTAPYNHQHHLLGSDGTDFDFGSLPPSSPPLLPSESFPTPSEFGSGITPEEEPYREGEDDGTEIYRVPSELPRTIGGAHTKEDVAALLHSLGLPAHEGNAWGGAAAGGGALDSSTMATLLQLIQSNAGAADSPALSTSTSNEMEEQVLGLLGKTRNGGDYDSLF